MKKYLTLFAFFLLPLGALSQSSENLLQLLQEQEKDSLPPLLPDRMIFTQSLLWGEKGLFRATGISPLSPEQRMKEIKLRNSMLKAHQIVGYLTLGGMLAQGIIGGKLYNGDNSLYQTHKTLGKAVTISYFTGAGLSLFAPPPLINIKQRGLSSIKAHKILATVHFSGMLATNLMATENKELHKAAAYTTFTAYALAVVVFKF